jgi:hypothetical protein
MSSENGQGAKRYVDGLVDDSYKSGRFYASKPAISAGPLVDQGAFCADLNNEVFQDNANQAIHRFVR